MLTALRDECGPQRVSSLIRLVSSVILLNQRNNKTTDINLSSYQMRTQTHKWIGDESKFMQSEVSFGSRKYSFDYIFSILFNWPDFLSHILDINKRLTVGMGKVSEWELSILEYQNNLIEY